MNLSVNIPNVIKMQSIGVFITFDYLLDDKP
jgi:hypothetical protein